MDYSKLSLTQAKRLEMESQVHALELEKELEMERTRLAELRKIHYHLAGASEGWEVCKYTDLTSSILLHPCISLCSPPPSPPTHTHHHRKNWRVNYPLRLSSKNMRTPIANFFFLLYNSA